MIKRILGSVLLLASIIVAQAHPSRAALTVSPCPDAIQAKIRTAGGALLACSEVQGIYWALQFFEVPVDGNAGVTLSIYEAKSLSGPSPVSLASDSQLGDKLLKFKFDGRLVDHMVFQTGADGKLGIVFRTFVPPHAGLFNSYSFDPATHKLTTLSGNVGSEAGDLPEISAQGVLKISTEGYSTEGVQTKSTQTYRFQDGRFVPLN